MARTLMIALLAMLISLVGLALHGYCDRGVIPVEGEVWRAEQRALIAWNGVEEVLALSVSVEPSLGSVEALEVLPLPSMPSVRLMDVGVFQSLIKEVFKGAGHRGPGVEVEFHEVLGPHDLWVLSVEDVEELGLWVQAYCEAKGLPLPSQLGEVLEVFRRYVRDGFRFFAIDAVKLEGGTWVEPLIYRFSSSYAYYPMEVSKLARGEVEATILLLTTRPINTSTAKHVGFAVHELGVLHSSRLGVEEFVEVLGGGPCFAYVLRWMGVPGDVEGDLRLSFVEGAGTWEPYVPSPSQVKLRLEEVNGRLSLRVSIIFPSTGFTVDWGRVQRSGSMLWVDVKPYRWTGPVALVLTEASHVYNLEGLEPGSYVFKLKAWGVEVGELRFTVEDGLDRLAELQASLVMSLLAALLIATSALIPRRARP